MNETTYTLWDGREFMVDRGYDGTVTDVYGYASDMREDDWEICAWNVALNSVFVHASDVKAAWEFIEEEAIDM